MYSLQGNVAVNAALSIVMADMTSGTTGFLISTFTIVIFGEIIPQALCSRHPLFIGAHTIYITWFIMFLLYLICKPMSVILVSVVVVVCACVRVCCKSRVEGLPPFPPPDPILSDSQGLDAGPRGGHHLQQERGPRNINAIEFLLFAPHTLSLLPLYLLQLRQLLDIHHEGKGVDNFEHRIMKA